MTIPLYRNSYEKWLDRQQDIAAINSLEPTHAVTFNTYLMLTCGKTLQLVREFERRMNRQIYGTQSKQKTHRLNWIHNFELKSGNAHMHSVVKLSDSEAIIFNTHARHIWHKVVKQGTQGTQGTKAKLWLDDYSAGVAVYITKGGAMVGTTA